MFCPVLFLALLQSAVIFCRASKGAASGREYNSGLRHLCFCSSASELLRGQFKLEQPPWVLPHTLYPAAPVSGAQNASVTPLSLTLPLCQGQRWCNCTNTGLVMLHSSCCIAGAVSEGQNVSLFSEMFVLFL